MEEVSAIANRIPVGCRYTCLRCSNHVPRGQEPDARLATGWVVDKKRLVILHTNKVVSIGQVRTAHRYQQRMCCLGAEDAPCTLALIEPSQMITVYV